jgi:hypothetical protein
MIRQFLDLSTAHVSQAAQTWLNVYAAENYEDGGDVETRHVASHSCGWWMWAGEEGTTGIHEDLLPVCLLARANGCDYILFDRDAEQIADLPIYDWNA